MNQDSLLYIYGVGLVVAVVVAFLLGQAAARRRAERAHLGASERAKKVEPGAQLPALDEKAAEGQDAVTIQKADASPMGATRASTASSVPWFSRLTLGLSKTQAQLVRQIESLFVGEHERASREALLDSMLEILVRADVGIRTSEMLIEKVRTSLPGSELTNPAAVMEVLRSEILTLLRNPTIQASAPQTNAEISSWSLIDSTPLAGQESRRSRVVLMVGVNGVGKTTTTGKLAFKERQAGHSVIVGAADTFRAAAVDQLEEWARRAGADCVRLSDGADPASVAFECVKRAVQQGTDLCLIDTAGRLHNRNDLMQELAKIRRVASKDLPGAPHEVLLVLDATTGQNAIQQARAFKEIAGVTGLVLTKLDGTAKGGVAIALANEMNLPIRYIGVGESVEDLQLFNAEEFVEALFQAPVRSTKETAPALELTQA